MKKIQIGLLGFGTVGTGVAKVLEQNGELISKRLGAELCIKKILVRDSNKQRYEGISREKFTEDEQEILRDDEIEIVIEVMGGTGKAKECILSALKNKKHVVTANKDLLAECMQELTKEAENNQRQLLFEASVAGAIPILRPLTVNLAGDKINEIMGIINGTTNYILTKMKNQKGVSFEEVLKEAQELGYAEADPTADVDALDAGRKAAILATLAFHSYVHFGDVFTEGIRNISEKDIAYAEKMNKTIKLIAFAKQSGEEIIVKVHPCMISSNHPLASVEDSFNAVFVSGNAAGDCMFYGRGAGELPTASAIVGDVAEIAKNILAQNEVQQMCKVFEKKKIADVKQLQITAFLRMKKMENKLDLQEIKGIFAENKANVQKIFADDEEWVFVVQARELDLEKATRALIEKKLIKEIASMIRLEGE